MLCEDTKKCESKVPILRNSYFSIFSYLCLNINNCTEYDIIKNVFIPSKIPFYLPHTYFF